MISYRRAKWLLIPLLLASGACATTRTDLGTVDPQVVEAEERRQRVLAMESWLEHQERLDRIASPLLRAAAPVCGERVGPWLGLRVSTIHAFEEPWDSAAAFALDLGDSLSVISVTPGSPAARARLDRGDRIVGLGGEPLAPGEDALQRFAARLDSLLDADPGIALTVARSGRERPVEIRPVEACDFGTVVEIGGDLNAYADGERIIIPTPMMRFTDDEELAVIVAHELAHNAMGHLDARRQNQLAGAFVGFLGDLAMAYAGYNTGGGYTAQGARAGAEAFSQDFEREADYVGLYALALAGADLEAALRFWRHMAQASPESIGLAFTHPTTAERFVRMQRTIDEIEEKRFRGVPLRPEMEGEEEDGGR